jgi:thymidylate synthase (FAD)
MKLINQGAEKVEQEYGSTKKELLVNMFKHIERCARTCYKSEDKITDKSYIKMIHNLITNKHYAMLEFGTMYFEVPENHKEINYLLTTGSNTRLKKWVSKSEDCLYITTNYRYYLEDRILRYFIDCLCPPTEFHEKRLTYKFTTNRAIANELVRHRVFSFAQESTRFCNYSKDKYNGLTFIIPSYLPKILEGYYKYTEYWYYGDTEITIYYSPTLVENLTDDKYELKSNYFVMRETLKSFENAENIYKELLKQSNFECTRKLQPQEVRDILPLALKTEICMCGFRSDWKRLYDVRVNGITGTPHPMIKELIRPLSFYQY